MTNQFKYVNVFQAHQYRAILYFCKHIKGLDPLVSGSSVGASKMKMAGSTIGGKSPARNLLVGVRSRSDWVSNSHSHLLDLRWGFGEEECMVVGDGSVRVSSMI